MTAKPYQTDVCIVGGGPAGMLLGLLLAARQIRVLVLEQHPDFEREYRGEVLMPRFAQLFSQLGLFEYMEQFPHTKLTGLMLHDPNGLIAQADFQAICPEFPFAFRMPQPIFLNALHQKAKAYPGFELWFNASARQLITEGTATKGIIAKVGDEEAAIQAKVTVGADGRFSKIHRLGHFENAVDTHKFDVLWFSLPRPPAYESTAMVYLGKNRLCLVLPKYPDLIQCGLLMKPDEFAAIKKQGIDAMRQLLMENGPRLFKAFAETLQDFTPFYPLQAKVTYVRRWAQDGLLLIGDAAHTCSPVGGIGVSVALATAAVAADVLVRAIVDCNVSAEVLDEVQRIREPEVRQIQQTQERISGIVTADSAWLFSILRHIIPLLFRLGIAQRFIRQVVVSQTEYATIRPL